MAAVHEVQSTNIPEEGMQYDTSETDLDGSNVTEISEVYINDCNNFIKVCDFDFNRTDSQSLIKTIIDPNIDRCLLRDTRGRCYSIVVDGKIYKIGGSDDAKGIGSIAGYLSGNGGSPSPRTCGIHYYIARELYNGNNVSLWCIWAPNVQVDLFGLSTEDNINSSVSIRSKELEKICLENFMQRTGRLPRWNMQEAGRSSDWSPTIMKICNSLPLSNTYLEQPVNIDDCDILLKLYHWKHNGYNLFPDN